MLVSKAYNSTGKLPCSSSSKWICFPWRDCSGSAYAGIPTRDSRYACVGSWVGCVGQTDRSRAPSPACSIHLCLEILVVNPSTSTLRKQTGDGRILSVTLNCSARTQDGGLTNGCSTGTVHTKEPTTFIDYPWSSRSICRYQLRNNST